MKGSRDFLQSMGLPGGDPADSPASTGRFPDGGQYRIEIPSTEGPRALEQVLSEAAKRKVPVHRVSQGSGIMLMTDDEITEMLEIGRKAGIEVNLFIGPRATFDIGAQAYSAAGKSLGLGLRGADQLVFGRQLGRWVGNALQQEPGAHLAELRPGVEDRRERRRRELADLESVEADDGHVLWHADPHFVQRSHDSDGGEIVVDEDCRGTRGWIWKARQELGGGVAAAGHEPGTLDGPVFLG